MYLKCIKKLLLKDLVIDKNLTNINQSLTQKCATKFGKIYIKLNPVCLLGASQIGIL